MVYGHFYTLCVTPIPLSLGIPWTNPVCLLVQGVWSPLYAMCHSHPCPLGSPGHPLSVSMSQVYGHLYKLCVTPIPLSLGIPWTSPVSPLVSYGHWCTICLSRSLVYVHLYTTIQCFLTHDPMCLSHFIVPLTSPAYLLVLGLWLPLNICTSPREQEST